jgi:hypothetical protein
MASVEFEPADFIGQFLDLSPQFHRSGPLALGQLN